MSEIGLDFEIIKPGSPTVVRFTGRDGKQREVVVSHSVTGIEENTNKSDENERFTVKSYWQMSKVRPAAIVLALLMLGASAYAKPIVIGPIIGESGTDGGPNGEPGVSGRGVLFDKDGCQFWTRDGKIIAERDKKWNRKATIDCSKRVGEQEPPTKAVASTANAWKAQGGGQGAGVTIGAGPASPTQDQLPPPKGGSASITGGKGGEGDPAHNLPEGAGGDVNLAGGMGHPVGSVNIGRAEGAIRLSGTATLNGKRIATVDMIPKIDRVLDHKPLLIGLAALGGIFGALLVGLTIAGWRGILNRLRLVRIRRWRAKQNRTADTGPFRGTDIANKEP